MRSVLFLALSFLTPGFCSTEASTSSYPVPVKAELHDNAISVQKCLCDLLRDSVHVTSAAARPNNELWCYKCHADVPEDECANLRTNSSALIHKCHNDRRMCMVKRFSYTTSTENSTTALKMWALERNCTKHCEPGCIVIGERTKLYACTSCCTDSLCNFGSGSMRIIFNTLALILTLFLVL